MSYEEPNLSRIWGLWMQDCGPSLPGLHRDAEAKSDTTTTSGEERSLLRGTRRRQWRGILSLLEKGGRG